MPVAPTLDAGRITARYAAGLRRMGRLTGFSPQAVLRAEAGSILKTWAGRTKVATLAQTDLRTRVRTIRHLDLTGGKANREATISVNAGLRGPFGRMFMRKRDGSGWRRTHEAGFSPLWQHYKRGDWVDLQEAQATVLSALERAIPASRRAIGLARQSVVQIADSLRIDLSRVPGGGISAAGLAKARAALASSGRAYRNGSGREGGDDIRPYIDLFNTLPYNSKIGMDRTLLLILAGRAAFFRRNYAAGVFKSQQATARAYPGLFTVTP